jgi:hypothetical protein
MSLRSILLNIDKNRDLTRSICPFKIAELVCILESFLEKRNLLKLLAYPTLEVKQGTAVPYSNYNMLYFFVD